MAMLGPWAIQCILAFFGSGIFGDIVVFSATHTRHPLGYPERGRRARDQYGTEFVIYNEYTLPTEHECSFEVHVNTDYYEGTLVDMMTPRLTAEDGGSFRKSVWLDRHRAATLCAPQVPGYDGPGPRDNVVLLTSERDIRVSVIVKTQGGDSADMFILYPTDVAGTLYYFLANCDCIVITVATEHGTHLDISSSTHDPKNTAQPGSGQNGRGAKTAGGSVGEKHRFHIQITLGKYQAYKLKTVKVNHRGETSDRTLTSDKPVVVLFQARHGSGSGKKGEDDSGQSYSVVQLLPTVTWDQDFYFRYPADQEVDKIKIQIWVMTSGEECLVWLYIPGKVKSKHSIPAGNNTVEIDLSPQPFEPEPIRLKVGRPAAVHLLLRKQAKKQEAYIIAKVPPVSQYNSLYIFSVGDGRTYLHIIIPAKHVDDISISAVLGTDISYPLPLAKGTSSTMFVTRSYTFIGPDVFILTHKHTQVVFGAFLETFAKGSSFFVYTELGMRFAPVNQKCTKTEMVPGDTLDNDCDGLVDEESPGANWNSTGKGDEAVKRVTGGLSEWTEWLCSGECHQGTLVKKRACTNPTPRFGDVSCTEMELHEDRPCDQSHIDCLKDCIYGGWGVNCENKCPPNCESRRCKRYTGECFDGCKAGYSGSSCSVPCHRGYGGMNCNTSCATICESRICDSVTTACKDRSVNLVTVSMVTACVTFYLICPAIGFLAYCYIRLKYQDKLEKSAKKDRKRARKKRKSLKYRMKYDHQVDQDVYNDDVYHDDDEDDDEDDDSDDDDDDTDDDDDEDYDEDDEDYEDTDEDDDDNSSSTAPTGISSGQKEGRRASDKRDRTMSVVYTRMALDKFSRKLKKHRTDEEGQKRSTEII